MFLSVYFLNALQLQLKTGHPIDGQLGNEIADYDRGNQIIIKIPKIINVLIKRTDSGVSYVDHVYRPIYHEEELKNYSQLDCGITDFEVIVHYCDCHEICNVYRNTSKRQRIPTRFFLNYGLHLHVHNNSLYFSTAINGERIENDNSSVNMPKNLMNRGNADKFFGPFRMADLTADVVRGNDIVEPRPRPPLEKAIKEWALYENTDSYYKQYIWEHQSEELSDVGRDEMEIRVTLSPGYIVSFSRFECLQLNEKHNFDPSNLTVNRGGCVKIYDGDGCTGATHIVFQEHVQLYSQDKTKQPIIPRVKSLSSCCPGFSKGNSPPYLYKSHGAGRRWTRNSQRFRIDCSCPCSVTPPSTTIRLPNAGRYTSVKKHWKYISPKLWDLLKINATAAAAMEASKERAVAAAMEDSPKACVAATVAAATTASIVAEMAYRTLALIESSPDQKVRDLYIRRLVEDVASSTAMSAKYAAWATPETASELALDVALESLCAQAFIADAILQVITNSDKLSESFKGLSEFSSKEIEISVGKKTSSSDSEEEKLAQKGEIKSGEYEKKKIKPDEQIRVKNNVEKQIGNIEHRVRERRNSFLFSRL